MTITRIDKYFENWLYWVPLNSAYVTTQLSNIALGTPFGDPALATVYYDAQEVAYRAADYFADNATWYPIAENFAKAYRDYWVIGQGAGDGKRYFPQGLTEDILRNGTTAARSAMNILLSTGFCITGSGAPDSEPYLPGEHGTRETAYALMTHLEARRPSTGLSANTARIAVLYGYAKGHLDLWITGGGSTYLRPFMAALTAKALIQYYEQYSADAIILTKLAALFEQIWLNMWGVVDGFGALSFKYTNVDTATLSTTYTNAGGTIPNPAYNSGGTEESTNLNLLIVPVFGWLYSMTGDQKWKDRGDLIFDEGISVYNGAHTSQIRGAYFGIPANIDGKNINQNYWWSYKYLQYTQQYIPLKGSSNLQPWARIDLVIKDLNNPASTKTLQFTNRPCRKGDSTYLPLLKSYSGLSLSLGQDLLPASGNGSIVLNDQWESLGENRRIFDYFDRFTAINQIVKVYRGINSIDIDSLPEYWTCIYTGKVESYTKDKETLTFSISNSLIESRITTKTITSDMAPAGYSVPEQSLGKALPVVFSYPCRVAVVGYPIKWSSTDLTSGRYAYATNLGTQFQHRQDDAVGFPPYLLAKDENGIYRNISGGGAEIQTNASGSNYPIPSGLTRTLVPIEGFTLAYLIAGCFWRFKGQNSGGITPVGDILLQIYRTLTNVVDQYTASWEPVGEEIVIDKANYLSQVRGASDFLVYGYLKKPVVAGAAGYGANHATNEYSYAVGMTLRNYGTSTTDFVHGGSSAPSGTFFYSQDGTGANFIAASGAEPVCGIVTAGLEFHESTTLDANGLSYSYADTGVSAGSTCNLAELDLAFVIQGIEDDAIGSLTGTNRERLKRPHQIAALLDYAFNGTSWTPGNIIDTGTFASFYSVFTSGNYQRLALGFTEGDTTSYELISKLASEMCCALVPLASGKLALWPFGAQAAVAKVFTDAQILDYGTTDETDPSTVINNIKIEYGKSFLNINDQWEASSQPANLSGVLMINKGTSDYWNSILSNSEALYGKRELADSGSQFIGDLTSATTRALYYALRHDHTHRTFTITVSYFENIDLKLMDIVDVLSVHNPSYLGSGFQARLPTYAGEDDDVFSGEYPTRATRRRSQIIGLNNDYDGDFPKLVITLKEIKPRHKNDPTAQNI